MDKRIWVVVGILVLVGLGLWFFSSMTGGVIGITGAVVGDGGKEMKVEGETFRISDFGSGEKEVVKNGEGGSE